MLKKSHDLDTKTIVITRLFDAPRELVFEAWSKPEYLLQWFAPRNCRIHFPKIDIRAGGSFHSCIHNPALGDCWCVGVYHEVIPPEKISYSIALADEQGNLIDPTSAGHDPNWPRETTVTVTFEQYEGKTRMTLKQNVSEELAKRTGAYPSWVEMFDRLDEMLHVASHD